MFRFGLEEGDATSSDRAVHTLIRDILPKSQFLSATTAFIVLSLWTAELDGSSSALQFVLYVAIYCFFMLLIGSLIEQEIGWVSYGVLLLELKVTGYLFTLATKPGVRLLTYEPWLSTYSIYWFHVFRDLLTPKKPTFINEINLDDSVSQISKPYTSGERRTRIVYAETLTESIFKPDVQSPSLKIRIYKCVLFSLAVFRSEPTFFLVFLAGIGNLVIHILYIHHSNLLSSVKKLFSD